MILLTQARIGLRLVVAAIGLATVMGAAQAASPSIDITLDGPGEWRTIAYECEGRDELLKVAYINVAPNFLALLPVEDETLVFVSVLSASGVRYASGQYEWWTARAEASLRDLTAPEDAEPLLTCLEANEIP